MMAGAGVKKMGDYNERARGTNNTEYRIASGETMSPNQATEDPD